MFKEKDKRIVLLVVFGAALVAAVSAIAAGFIDSLTVFCCSGRLRTFQDDFYYLVAGILLSLCVLGIGYVVVKIFVRKTFIPSLVLSLVIVCYTIASIIALCCSIPLDNSGFYMERYYSFYMTTHVAVSVSLAISVALAEVSHLFVIRKDRKDAKEEAQQAEPQVTVDEQ